MYRGIRRVVAFAAIFTLIIQPVFGIIYSPSVHATSQNITKVAFESGEQAIEQNTRSAKLQVRLQNANSTNEALSSTAKLTVSSSSVTGRFAGTATAGFGVTNVQELTFSSGDSGRSFYYQDSTSGSHLITAKVSGGGLSAEVTETQAITIKPVNFPADVTAPTIPSGGLPHDTYKTTNEFDFTWDASRDDRQGEVEYEFRISKDPSQVGTQEDSEAWKSGYLSEARIHSITDTDGVWYWQVRAIDITGNKSAWSDVWNVTVDTTRPTLRILQPQTNEIFGGPDKKRMTVESFLQDDQGLELYSINIDGHAAPVETEEHGTLSASASLTIFAHFNSDQFDEGEHTINVSVTDKAGNVTSESRAVIFDRTTPIISTSVLDGQTLSGTVALDLLANETNPKQYGIQVLDNNGNPISVDGVLQEKRDANSSADVFIYDWDSSRVPNGTYKIQFSAKDGAGYETAMERTVVVQNVVVVDPVPPNLTMDGALTGRTVTGVVSAPSVVFQVKINGVIRNDITPIVGGEVEGGYSWQFVLPEDVKTGLVTIDIIAAADGASSSWQTRTFMIRSGETTVGGNSGSTNDPLLELLSTSLQQPFVIPNTSEAAFIANALSNPESRGESTTDVLGVETAKAPTGSDVTAKTPAVAATENGWRVFGVLWYWWLLMIGAVLVVWRVTVRRHRPADV